MFDYKYCKYESEKHTVIEFLILVAQPYKNKAHKSCKSGNYIKTVRQS